MTTIYADETWFTADAVLRAAGESPDPIEQLHRAEQTFGVRFSHKAATALLQDLGYLAHPSEYRRWYIIGHGMVQG